MAAHPRPPEPPRAPLAPLAPLAARGQPVYSGRSNQLRVAPPRLDETGLIVDGKLNEPQWARAALLTGFSQFSPSDGVPAEDSTEVLVWYSATAIHFGVRAFEKHGTPRATLADRDKISADDGVQILIGTFNDGRQAAVFAVNPFGIQADGTILETNQGPQSDFGGATYARNPADLSADFVFQSKGMLTPDGYVVEIRIPFKSLKYQAANTQSWGLNVVREVQHSGHEDTWAPARRAGLSFLGQSGTLEGLTDIHRGLVLDLNPELTQRTEGVAAASSGSGWTYTRKSASIGGTARMGVSNNLTLSATANPDFSQIESDAGQLTFDPRQALFFNEKRSFFLEGTEQFSVPHSLMYTRQIVQPVVAAKLAGKISGLNVGILSAIDNGGGTAQLDRPLFNLVRLQRDIGTASKLGIAYTSRADGTDYNRVADIDGSYVFGDIYSAQLQYAQSSTKRDTSVTTAPLWHAGINRNGKHLAFSYSLDGVSEHFITQSGYISRTGVVELGIDQRYTLFGSRRATLEALTINPALFSNWRYQSFVHSDDAIEKKAHLSLNATFRGGWNAGIGYFAESYGFDPSLYSRYRVQAPDGTTSAFVGTPRIPNSEQFFSFSTPPGAKLSASGFYLWGHDENFFEWASSNIIIGIYGVTIRPTEKLRVNATLNISSYNRPSDGSTVAKNRIPRLKIEYQIARPIFLRLVGEYDSFYTDRLRDESRTGRPLIVGGQPTASHQSSSFRGDFLFSLQPTPGTVFFLGYGAGYRDTRSPAQSFDFPASLGFRGYNRTDDAIFLKASYLFRH